MTLRARTLNSSGEVERSRNPRRLSATSGWLLTFSGTIVLDEAPDGIHGHLEHAVHVRRVEMVDLAGAELVHAQVDRAGAQPPQAGDHEERGRLHVVAEHAGPRPHLELVTQVRP